MYKYSVSTGGGKSRVALVSLFGIIALKTPFDESNWKIVKNIHSYLFDVSNFWD